MEEKDTSEMQEKDNRKSSRVKKCVSLAESSGDFCQVQIITFLTRIPATMSIGRHLMRLQLFQGICFMNHTLWWSDFEKRIRGIQGDL